MIKTEYFQDFFEVIKFILNEYLVYCLYYQCNKYKYMYVKVFMYLQRNSTIRNTVKRITWYVLDKF